MGQHCTSPASAASAGQADSRTVKVKVKDGTLECMEWCAVFQSGMYIHALYVKSSLNTCLLRGHDFALVGSQVPKPDPVNGNETCMIGSNTYPHVQWPPPPLTEGCTLG